MAEHRVGGGGMVDQATEKQGPGHTFSTWSEEFEPIPRDSWQPGKGWKAAEA